MPVDPLCAIIAEPGLGPVELLVGLSWRGPERLETCPGERVGAVPGD